MVISNMGNIAMIGRPDKYTGGDQSKNANLIAASPDLLIAYEALLHATKLGDSDGMKVAVTLAHYAVKKAIGENDEKS